MSAVIPARRRAAVVVAAALAVAAGVVTPVAAVPAAGVAGAAPGTAARAVPAPARIAVDGAYNARTFANYTTANGQAISDRVIRSADLQNVTDRGVRTLREHDVTTIIDLRTDVERTVKPNRPIPGVKTVVADVMALAPLAGSADFPGMYRTFVDNPGARQAYGKMLDAVLQNAEAGHTTLINCSAGRDRTGWAAAVILRTLGVDMPVVEADFTAGNMGTDVRWLRGAFAHATALYGSFDNYLAKGLGFSSAQQQRLRAALTAVD